MPDPLQQLASLVDVAPLLTYRVAALAVVFLFFACIYLLGAVLRRAISLARVATTLKTAILGFLALTLARLPDPASPLARALDAAASLIVVLCAANLLIYLVADVYLFVRRKGHVPSLQREILTVLVYAVFALVSLRVIFRIDVAAILTTTTILTAALALAMQTTIANVLAGFHVHGDPNLSKGTWIALRERDVEGRVENVGFRYTTLRTVDNQRILVPNHDMMRNAVVCTGSRAEREFSAVHLKVHLGFEQPPERVKAILLPILRHQKGIAKEPAPSVWVTGFGESAVEYDLRYFLEDPALALPVRGHVLEKVWYALNREGISLPYPHREILDKVPKEPFPRDEERIRDAMRRAEVLGEIGEARLSGLAAKARRKTYAAGEVVVRENDEGDSLFLVKRGTLDVSVGGSNVGRLGPGEVFGEMSLLTGERRRATVAAAAETVLLEVSKVDIEPILRADPALVERLGSVLARRAETNLERLRVSENGTSAPSRREALVKGLRAFFGI